MKELIIKDLQKITNQLEKTPTRDEYFKITSLKISRKTILKYFDSYTDAIEQADLNEKSIIINCNTCDKELTRTKSTLSTNNFCNHSCAAKFTNNLRYRTKKEITQICRYCSTKLNHKDRLYCNNKCQKDFEYTEYISNWKIGKILRICR